MALLVARQPPQSGEGGEAEGAEGVNPCGGER